MHLFYTLTKVDFFLCLDRVFEQLSLKYTPL
jgi:hypothetical protein